MKGAKSAGNKAKTPGSKLAVKKKSPAIQKKTPVLNNLMSPVIQKKPPVLNNPKTVFSNQQMFRPVIQPWNPAVPYHLMRPMGNTVNAPSAQIKAPPMSMGMLPPMHNSANMNRLKDPLVKPLARPVDEEKDSDLDSASASHSVSASASASRSVSVSASASDSYIELPKPFTVTPGGFRTHPRFDTPNGRPFGVEPGHKCLPHPDLLEHLEMGDTLACKVLTLFNLDTWEERRAMMVNNFDDIAGLALKLRKTRMTAIDGEKL